MKIGFFSNQLDNRGTGNALYNYAHYNETLLGNKSFIFTQEQGNHDGEAFHRFKQRFENIFYPGWDFSMIDALYHIKSGYNDGFSLNNIPYLVHSVFDNDPHGTVYATISPWMGRRFNLPFVPHIVEVAGASGNLRAELGIPQDAVVFGNYGGRDSFDVPFAWMTIFDYIANHENVYFIFMNTDVPSVPVDRIISAPPTVDPVRKRQFINTCDAMIHARARGETFGIAVGEFAICGKPVITYSESHERAHLQELGHFALTYKNSETLVDQFNKVVLGPMVSWGYGQYTPYNVMAKFEEVFLSCLT